MVDCVACEAVSLAYSRKMSRAYWGGVARHAIGAGDILLGDGRDVVGGHFECGAFVRCGYGARPPASANEVGHVFDIAF